MNLHKLITELITGKTECKHLAYNYCGVAYLFIDLDDENESEYYKCCKCGKKLTY